jgi:hypothetical protein
MKVIRDNIIKGRILVYLRLNYRVSEDIKKYYYFFEQNLIYRY